MPNKHEQKINRIAKLQKRKRKTHPKQTQNKNSTKKKTNDQTN